MLNFIYPSKSAGFINVEAALNIDFMMTARGYQRNILVFDYISGVRQIDTLLTQLVNTICSSSNKISQPGDMIGQATALQNAISCFGDKVSKEDIDND